MKQKIEDNKRSDIREEITIMENRLSGTVKWFSVGKGYGFITAEGEDYFAHFSQIRQEGFRKLLPGQAVTFTVGDDGNGRTLAQDIETVD